MHKLFNDQVHCVKYFYYFLSSKKKNHGMKYFKWCSAGVASHKKRSFRKTCEI
uniref:Uncharacterized protein n=1 Tax=Arundo donax TaxID=35708 RepID=A0A0A9QNA6_ARUDO